MPKNYSKIDQEILEAIQSYEGVPNPCNLSKRRGGPLKYTDGTIGKRLKKNPELRQALESRGILFIETCDRKTFDEYFTTLQLTSATGKTRKAIDKRLDTYILEAIESYRGIPNAPNLSKINGGPLEFSPTLIENRLKRNSELRQTLESRGIRFVETCDRNTFDECTTSGQLAQEIGKIRKAIDKRFDACILDAINSYEGIPTAFNLSKANGGSLEYGPKTIRKRLKKNLDLQQALEIRGIRFIETCDKKMFDECVTTKQWTSATGKTREAIENRLDTYVLEGIQLYQGIPTVFSLSKANGGPLEYSHTTIGERLKKNPDLQKALEARGVQFIETCNRKTFDECFTTGQWKRATGKMREAIDERLDAYILEAINSYEGIPTAFNLSKANGGSLEYGHVFIGNRLKKNPDLQQALEARGVQFIETRNRKTFDECFTTGQWKRATGKMREAIDKRLDEYILETINSYEGIPTSFSLSKTKGGPLEYNHTFIRDRLKKNPKLQEALESRGNRFVEICDRKKFDECIITWQWTRTTGKTKEAIDKRLDACILEAIQSHPGILTAHNLSKVKGGPLEYSHSLIGERLKKNPELRRALYLKRGLTEDRINALEIEQDNPSTALVESVRRRLPNTRVFREALGILRQFREIFEARMIHEVSFYPEPLLKASEMLGIQLNHDYTKAHKLKRSDYRYETNECDSIAMLQFCHRLSQEALINTFNETNRIRLKAGLHLFHCQLSSLGLLLSNRRSRISALS